MTRSSSQSSLYKIRGDSHRLRTLDDLRRYAARHGITIPVPPAAATTPHDTLADPATP